MLAKRLLRQPRPSALCAVLETCGEPGMPSSHTQVMFAALTIWLLAQRAVLLHHVLRRAAKHATPLARLLPALELLALCALCCGVGMARAYLGYHTAGQVVAGAALGVAGMLSWHALAVATAQGWQPTLRRALCTLRPRADGARTRE